MYWECEKCQDSVDKWDYPSDTNTKHKGCGGYYWLEWGTAKYPTP